jgi:hypothetical protein
MLTLYNTVWKELESAMFLSGRVSAGLSQTTSACLASIMRIALFVSNGLSHSPV